jgi:hypothetical protein
MRELAHEVNLVHVEVAMLRELLAAADLMDARSADARTANAESVMAPRTDGRNLQLDSPVGLLLHCVAEVATGMAVVIGDVRMRGSGD